MSEEIDNQFYDRADAYIDLANSQINEKSSHVDVSASLLYSASRFNTWVTATGFSTAKEMAAEKEQILEHFIKEYRDMLEDNLTDYIDNFNEYMGKT